MMRALATGSLLLLNSAALAAAPAPVPVLADLSLLARAGVAATERDAELGLGVAQVSPAERERLARLAHEEGKCGGYELLKPASSLTAASPVASPLAELRAHVGRDRAAAKLQPLGPPALAPRPEIANAVKELREENIRATVEWLSAYPSRDHALRDPNGHVRELERRLHAMLVGYPGAARVETIAHTSTRQLSLRVHLEGKSRPQEIVVLGGHLDSLNQSWLHHEAPGADDNASGAANLVEALRVLLKHGAPERSVEFFWYAGEEAGLLGSAEIAADYRAHAKDVVAVLQLDMTAFPGAGEFVLGNVTDYTSPWLQRYLVALNDTYVQARIIPDECGYACSDHASWYRQGYATLMPFEADSHRMNPAIHHAEDVIKPELSFRHSLTFAKLALAFAQDLANTTRRAP